MHDAVMHAPAAIPTRQGVLVGGLKHSADWGGDRRAVCTAAMYAAAGCGIGVVRCEAAVQSRCVCGMTSSVWGKTHRVGPVP